MIAHTDWSVLHFVLFDHSDQHCPRQSYSYFQGQLPRGTVPPEHQCRGIISELIPSTAHGPQMQSHQPLCPLVFSHTSFLHPRACSNYHKFQPINIHSSTAFSLHYFNQSQALFPETVSLFPVLPVFSCTHISAASGEVPHSPVFIHQHHYTQLLRLRAQEQECKNQQTDQRALFPFYYFPNTLRTA